jgi:lysophospholipase L1-like esterase
LLALCITTALAAAAAPAAAQAADYVAMGDSYSSGTGTRQYYEGCERSVHSYPYLIKGSFGSSFSFVACGGARTQDVLNNQVSALSAATKFATISIGGNDAGFSSVITECAQPGWLSDCNGAINNAQAFIQNTLPGRLDQVNNAIKSRAASAKVIVLDYPRLFNGEDCNAGTWFSPSEESRLNQTADMLKSVLSAAAARAGANFLVRDVIPPFIGHAVCDGGGGSSTEWINGLSNPIGESYHPKTTGHANGYYPVVHNTTG